MKHILDLFGPIEYIVWMISFILIWLYALDEWGFLIALAIGWLPAAIGATIMAFIWPIVVLVFLVIFGLDYFKII